MLGVPIAIPCEELKYKGIDRKLLAKVSERKDKRNEIMAKNEEEVLIDAQNDVENMVKDVEKVEIDKINEIHVVEDDGLMPSLAFVEKISPKWDQKDPTKLTWWNSASVLTFEISFHQIFVHEIELTKSNLYIRLEHDMFSMQYLVENSTLVCMKNYKLAKSIVPKLTRWHINGLTLVINMSKGEEDFWDIPSPFLTENGRPLKKSWITLNPMKMDEENEDEDIFANLTPPRYEFWTSKSKIRYSIEFCSRMYTKNFYCNLFATLFTSKNSRPGEQLKSQFLFQNMHFKIYRTRSNQKLWLNRVS